MTGRLQLAVNLAYKAHEGQVDKAGQPYIYHPLRVAALVAEHGEDYAIVGLLHDVVEDTDVTIETVREIFGDVIADAVLSVTHFKPPKYSFHEKYFDYIARVKSNPIGRIVKLADLKDNSSPTRMSALSQGEQIGLGKRYQKAKKILEDV